MEEKGLMDFSGVNHWSAVAHEGQSDTALGQRAQDRGQMR